MSFKTNSQYEMEKYLQNEAKTAIMTSVDELTLVVRPTADTIGEYPEHWSQIAGDLAINVAEKLLAPIILGNYCELTRKPNGYTNGFTFDKMPHGFAIAWHETYFTMGIIIKFSASALSHYQSIYKERYGENIDVHEIVQALAEPYWELRISRIDLAVDYFNYEMTVNDIYQGIKTGDITIRNHEGKKSRSKHSAVENNGIANTIYIGSKKKNGNALLRIYDKYQEQIDSKGRFLHLTKYCNSWVRFEVSYRHSYSNQILPLLLIIDSPQELSQLIIDKLLDKYRFIGSSNKAIPFTQDLLEQLKESFPPLKSVPSRNNDLAATIHYTMKGSGFYPLLKKIEKIWGTQARNHFIIRLVQEYEANYYPNKDVEIWLNKFGKGLVDLNFSDYLEDTFTVFYKNNDITPKRPAKNTKSDADK
ncbi:replication initiation factor domain-containing protein [Streptococcus orisratti]